MVVDVDGAWERGKPTWCGQLLAAFAYRYEVIKQGLLLPSHRSYTTWKRLTRPGDKDSQRGAWSLVGTWA